MAGLPSETGATPAARHRGAAVRFGLTVRSLPQTNIRPSVKAHTPEPRCTPDTELANRLILSCQQRAAAVQNVQTKDKPLPKRTTQHRQMLMSDIYPAHTCFVHENGSTQAASSLSSKLLCTHHTNLHISAETSRRHPVYIERPRRQIGSKFGPLFWRDSIPSKLSGS